MLAVGLLLWPGAVALAPPREPLRLMGTIALAGVEGRIDHMALDADRQRLFVVALGNNTVEVLDLRSGRRVRSLGGFREPQGVGFVASPPRLFIANGGDGSVALLDPDSFRLLRTIPLGGDADNVRVDGGGGRLFVGYGGGGLATLAAGTGDLLQRVELPAHPESFQLESGGSRIFVNVPESGEVVVVDREEGHVEARWPLGDAQGNYPMALDPAGRRLFVGCRRPSTVLVMDTATGKTLARLPIDGDADDLFFDPPTQRLFASCGAGFIDVVEAPASGRLRHALRIPTAAGARTSLYDAAGRRLYVAVPHRGAQPAEVRVFEVAR